MPQNFVYCYHLKLAMGMPSAIPRTTMGTVVTPAGVTSTCTSGSERMLDYALMSSGLQTTLEESAADLAVPWKPHCGIKLVLSTELDMATVRMVQPAPPLLRGPPLADEAKLECTWEEATQFALELATPPSAAAIADATLTSTTADAPSTYVERVCISHM